jgi:hypothetical protein
MLGGLGSASASRSSAVRREEVLEVHVDKTVETLARLVKVTQFSEGIVSLI